MSLTPTVKGTSIKDALRVHLSDSLFSVYQLLHATCRQTERNELSRGESELVLPLGVTPQGLTFFFFYIFSFSLFNFNNCFSFFLFFIL